MGSRIYDNTVHYDANSCDQDEELEIDLLLYVKFLVTSGREFMTKLR